MNKKILLIVLAAFFYLVPSHFTTEISAPAVLNVAQAAAPIIPTNLTIPNAKVNTNIIEVGITPKGNLDVPGNYTEVGWYKYGARPGEVGSAVLDGHVDNGGSIPGPFKHLRDLKAGDDIFVTMSDGKVLRYKVTLSEVYPTNAFPGQKVFHENDNRYLKIITCHGKFVPSLRTYDERLIVTAVLDL
jgi:sortase A